jgi:nucleoid DNA-binding protein
LDWWVQQGEGFDKEMFSLLGAAVGDGRDQLQAANELTPERLREAVERCQNAAAAAAALEKPPEKKQKKPSTRRNRHSNSFRDRVLRHLHEEKGLSWPKAERGFQAVFQVIRRALYRGEAVELPGLGVLTVRIRKGQPYRIFRPMRNVHTGQTRYRIANMPGDQTVIKFRPNQRLDLMPPPAPPPPLTAEELAARQVAAELLDRPVNTGDMECLQAAINRHPHKAGALLRRLQEAKKRSRSYQGRSVEALAFDLAERLYWI